MWYECWDMLSNRVDCLVEWQISLWRLSGLDLWLVYELDNDINEVELADGGYNDGGDTL